MSLIIYDAVLPPPPLDVSPREDRPLVADRADEITADLIAQLFSRISTPQINLSPPPPLEFHPEPRSYEEINNQNQGTALSSSQVRLSSLEGFPPPGLSNDGGNLWSGEGEMRNPSQSG
jgi:hypothetical protein